jgi:hypothetical protein
MTNAELTTLLRNYPALADQSVTVEAAREAAGGVPLYMRKYLLDRGSFESGIISDVGDSVRESKKDLERWPAQLKSIIFSVLEVSATIDLVYDKQYLIPVTTCTPGRCLYKALSPPILTAYRQHLWHEIMQYIHDEGISLLDIVAHSAFTGVPGRLFEHLVIHTIHSKGVRLKWEKSSFTLLPKVTFCPFHGMDLPPWPLGNGLWIPSSAAFPAIDFFVKRDSTVVAFKVHLGPHRDVAPEFFAMCESAGWFRPTSSEVADGSWRRPRSTSRTVVLVYLSPDNDTKALVKGHVKDKFYRPPSAIEDTATLPCSWRTRAIDGIVPHAPKIALVAWCVRHLGDRRPGNAGFYLR